MLLDTFDAEQFFANRLAIIPGKLRRRTSEDAAHKRLQGDLSSAPLAQRNTSGEEVAQSRTLRKDELSYDMGTMGSDCESVGVIQPIAQRRTRLIAMQATLRPECPIRCSILTTPASAKSTPSLLLVQSHQDVMIMVAKSTTENIDPSRMGGVVVDADPQAN